MAEREETTSGVQDSLQPRDRAAAQARAGREPRAPAGGPAPGAGREPGAQAAPGRAAEAARRAASRRRRLHPRSAAARAAAGRVGPGQGRARRRNPARSLGRGARDADRAHGRAGAGRGHRAARHRRDRRPRARPAARGDPGRLPLAVAGGARAVALGDVLPRRHGRRADGFRHDQHPRRRDRRSRAALPAPARRDAGPHRPVVRGRRHGPARRAAAGQPPAGHGPGNAGYGGDAAGLPQAPSARESRRTRPAPSSATTWCPPRWWTTAAG